MSLVHEGEGTNVGVRSTSLPWVNVQLHSHYSQNEVLQGGWMSTIKVSLATQKTIIKDHKIREPSKHVRIENSFTKEWCKNEIFVMWDKEL